MLEVILRPLLPSSTVQTVGQSGNINLGGSQIPPLIAALPPGSLLSGFVLNRDASGNPVLRTALGDFTMESELFLKIGSDVVLRVDASGKNFRAHLISIDGQPAEELALTQNPPQEQDAISRSPVAQVQAGSQPKTPTSLGGIPIAPSSPSPAPVIGGQLLSLHPEVARLPEARAIPPGQWLSVQVTRIIFPPIPTSPPPPGALLSSAPSAPNAPSSPLASPPQASSGYQAYAKGALPPFPSAILASGDTFGEAPSPSAPAASSSLSAPAQRQANVSSLPSTLFTPPPEDAVEMPIVRAFLRSPTAPLTLSATVIGAEGGEPLAHTALGLVRLQSAQPLPTGTKMSVQLTPSAPPTPAVPLMEPELPASVPLAPLDDWEAATRLLTALEDSGHSVLLGAFHALLPHVSAQGEPRHAGAAFGSALLLFYAALKGGDGRSWLGERNAKAIEEAGFMPLLSRLEGDFSALRQGFQASLPHTWQSFVFPVWDEARMQFARFSFKRGKKQEEGKRDGKDYSRFLVELDLSTFGPMQLDGLVRWPEARTQFDLIIRSQRPLRGEDQQEILAIYHGAGELTGFKGSLQFHVMREFPPLPPEDGGQESGHAVVV